MIRNIPLNKLGSSTRNVRWSSDPAADAELKADIEARGLLQNLIVTAAKKPRGSFAVEGGGRRLGALCAIAADGKSAKDVDIPCLIPDDIGTNAAEASLAENFQRLSLTPRDECLAFQHFTDEGSDVEGVTKRFGVSTDKDAHHGPVVTAAHKAGQRQVPLFASRIEMVVTPLCRAPVLTSHRTQEKLCVVIGAKS
jgi:ParB-like chromosome segregation protein Spo0J